jgi:DNA-binding NarL/FixJ family response regulator
MPDVTADPAIGAVPASGRSADAVRAANVDHTMTRVLIVDPQRAVGEALAAALSIEPDISVVGVVSDGAAGGVALSARTADVLLIDPWLPGRAGAPGQDAAGLIRRLRGDHNRLPIVAVTDAAEPRLVVTAVRAGVCSWVPKRLGVRHLVAVLRGTAAGESWFPSALLGRILPELTQTEPSGHEKKISSLSDRESEILRCMTAGLDRSSIADRLVLSKHTVRTHIQNLMAKLDVHSALEAVAVGFAAGLTTPNVHPHPRQPAPPA